MLSAQLACQRASLALMSAAIDNAMSVMSGAWLKPNKAVDEAAKVADVTVKVIDNLVKSLDQKPDQAAKPKDKSDDKSARRANKEQA
jgi:hypothetical protein